MKSVHAGPALAALFAFSALGATCANAEEERGIAWHWAKSEKFCDKNCSVAIYAGKFLHTEMVQVFAQGEKLIPIWNWTYEDSYLLAAAFSRRIGGFGRFIDIEGEVGAGKRFGDLSESEFWATFYYRWKYFPWNKYLRTTIAVSTGFNWASGIPDSERIRAINKSGRQFLHFFSPEITFGLPDKPDWDLMLRIHHRSGWWVFPNIGGGAQFFTVGVRRHF